MNWIVMILCALGIPVALLILYVMLVIAYESIKCITLYIMDKDRYNELKEKEMQNALDVLIFSRFII